MKRLWRDYGLSITLFLLMVFALVIQGVMNYHEYGSEQIAHGEVFEWSGYLVFFLGRWAENAQSEWLQLLTFVVLTAHLYHKGSHESKDNDEEVDAKLCLLLTEVEVLRGEIRDHERSQQRHRDFVNSLLFPRHVPEPQSGNGD